MNSRCTFAALLLASVSFAQTVTITAPANNTVAAPGQTVPVTVTLSSPGSFAQVALYGRSPIALVNIVPAAASMNFSVALPAGLKPARYSLMAIAFPSSGSPVLSQSIDLVVQGTTAPSTIQSNLSQLTLDAPGATFPLIITGVMPDGSKVDFTESPQIVWSSGTASIATISSDGVVAAVAPGTTVIGAQLGNLSLSIPVLVKSPAAAPCTFSLNSTSGAIDASGGVISVNVTASGPSCTWVAVSGVLWVTPGTGALGSGNGSVTLTVGPNTTGLSRSGTAQIAGLQFTVNQSNTSIPALALSRTSLNFGVNGSAITSTQPITVSFTAGSAGWTATSNQPNITVAPASGTGNGILQISVTAGASGTVTVTAPGAKNSPQQIQVSVANVINSAPFGTFETPANNTTGIAGAIAVTGWALDNVEVSSVGIWRERVGSEPVASNGLVFIGNATFVAGARPDVEAANPSAPLNYRAGWGYLLLTNFLPANGGSTGLGNGNYKLHAIAVDKNGQSVDLGTRTITVDNAHASRPFGTIDTPDQGGLANGTQFVNFGWALTQNPYCIPIDGSSITVLVDGVSLGHPTYNQLRNDIATLFPGLCNSNGAIGYYRINTTALTNGVHTISWIVYDNQGRGDGVGSRFFTVFNTATATVAEPVRPAPVGRVRLRRGFDLTSPAETLAPDRNGVLQVELEEMDRLELQLGAASGYLLVNREQRPLPTGSVLKGGVFYWQLAPVFHGIYDLVFERPGGTQMQVRLSVRAKTYEKTRSDR